MLGFHNYGKIWDDTPVWVPALGRYGRTIEYRGHGIYEVKVGSRFYMLTSDDFEVV